MKVYLVYPYEDFHEHAVFLRQEAAGEYASTFDGFEGAAVEELTVRD